MIPLFTRFALFLSLIFLLSMCTIVSGNGKVVTEIHKTDKYDKIEVNGSMDVELVEGTEGNIEVTAEENLMEYIVITVKNKKLTIDTKDGVGFSSTKGIKVKVPVEEITSVKLDGSGDIRTNFTLLADEFNGELDGSGDLTLNLKAKTVDILLDGSGDVTLKGSVEKLKCELDGSGDIHAYQLKAKNADVLLDGSGDIKVYANNKLKARLDGSGDINYKGNPAEVITNDQSGSGDITKH